MADWVHCNKCFIQPTSNCKEKFYLTNCGHIFCGPCCAANGKDTEIELSKYFENIFIKLQKNPRIVIFVVQIVRQLY